MMHTRACSPAPGRSDGFKRWLGPCAALLVGAAAFYVVGRDLAHFHLREIVESLHSIPAATLLAAAAATLASYSVLSLYDVLALSYIRRRVAYARVLFTSFVTNAFGHNLSLAAFTGTATRLRLYAPFGLTLADIAP